MRALVSPLTNRLARLPVSLIRSMRLRRLSALCRVERKSSDKHASIADDRIWCAKRNALAIAVLKGESRIDALIPHKKASLTTRTAGQPLSNQAPTPFHYKKLGSHCQPQLPQHSSSHRPFPTTTLPSEPHPMAVGIGRGKSSPRMLVAAPQNRINNINSKPLRISNITNRPSRLNMHPQHHRRRLMYLALITPRRDRISTQMCKHQCQVAPCRHREHLPTRRYHSRSQCKQDPQCQREPHRRSCSRASPSSSHLPRQSSTLSSQPTFLTSQTRFIRARMALLMMKCRRTRTIQTAKLRPCFHINHATSHHISKLITHHILLISMTLVLTWAPRCQRYTIITSILSSHRAPTHATFGQLIQSHRCRSISRGRQISAIAIQ